MLAYVAGPIFSEGERAFAERLAALCVEAGFSVFLPHRDVGLVEPGNPASVAAAYGKDLEALRLADLVVANLDGADVDSGTAFELGFALALGKPTFGLRTDSRCFRPGLPTNVMIDRSVRTLSSADDLLTSLARFSMYMVQR